MSVVRLQFMVSRHGVSQYIGGNIHILIQKVEGFAFRHLYLQFALAFPRFNFFKRRSLWFDLFFFFFFPFSVPISIFCLIPLLSFSMESRHLVLQLVSEGVYLQLSIEFSLFGVHVLAHVSSLWFLSLVSLPVENL